MRGGRYRVRDGRGHVTALRGGRYRVRGGKVTSMTSAKPLVTVTF